MGRKPVLNKINLFEATAQAVSFNIDPTVTTQLDLLRYCVAWSNGNTPDFDIDLQFTHDDVSTPQERADATWFSLPLASTPNVSGISGSHTIDVTVLNGKAHRLAFTRNAGDCDFNINVSGNALGA